MVSPSVASLFTLDWFASKLMADIEREAGFAILFERDGVIQGYAAGKDCEERSMSELNSLYVCPRAQGAGIGSKLITEVKGVIMSSKKTSMIVWTFLGAKNNDFYQRHKPIRKDKRDIVILDQRYQGVGFLYSLEPLGEQPT